MKTFGINGFGRIGRTAFRVWWQKHADNLDLKLINTSGSMDLADWVQLLKYDSNYGVWSATLSYQTAQPAASATDDNPVLGTITIGQRQITVTAQKEPTRIPWSRFGVEVVIEATGKFTDQDAASGHLQAGAQRVIISAPPKGEGEMPTSIVGLPKPPEAAIISNASCTTNSVVPVMAVIHRAFGIKKAMLTTVHAYTDDQNLHDNSHRDLRRARAAGENIIPTSTGAALSTTEVIPELRGKFDGQALRVPVSVGSLSDIVIVTNQPTTVTAINQALMEASQTAPWKGILAVTDEPIVSSDIKGRSESAIVDLSLTKVVDGDLVKIMAWYDNEWGYCNRLIEQVG